MNNRQKTKSIKLYWAGWLVRNGKFSRRSKVIKNSFCFACGKDCGDGKGQKYQIAHITPKRFGGDNGVNNLHLLCPECHSISEYMYGDEYFDWFLSVDWFDNVYRLLPRHKKKFYYGSLVVA